MQKPNKILHRGGFFKRRSTKTVFLLVFCVFTSKPAFRHSATFAKYVHVSGKMCMGNCLQRLLSFPSKFDFMFLSPSPPLPSSLGNKRRETFFPLDVRTDFSLPSRPAPRSISFSAFSGNRGASKSEKKKFSPRKKEGGENLF